MRKGSRALGRKRDRAKRREEGGRQESAVAKAGRGRERARKKMYEEQRARGEKEKRGKKLGSYEKYVRVEPSL